ncbi:hypothetical protein DEJ38_06475 [Kocuria rosea]|uniref:PIN-like domain-containing protein n=1 Tax=Kocuria rosea TaxID=1275 RepID=UPI000D65A36B|nr:hypothetical protein [Kocuria rosea]PWF82338.1 hypothetical protein DEJ38_06475 [Kocuria rosea]
MRIFIDENVPHALGKVLAAAYPEVHIRTHLQEQLSSWEDVDLINELKHRDFDALVTHDGRQLHRSDERAALRDCHIDWIGLPDLTEWGTSIREAMSGVACLGVAYYLRSRRQGPHAYHTPLPTSPSKAPTIEPL